MLRGIPHSLWETENSRGEPKVVRPIGTEVGLGRNHIMCGRERSENQIIISFWPQKLTLVFYLKQLKLETVHKTWDIGHWLRTRYTGLGDKTGGAAAGQDTKTAAVGYPSSLSAWVLTSYLLCSPDIAENGSPCLQADGNDLAGEYCHQTQKALEKRRYSFYSMLKKGACGNNFKAWVQKYSWRCNFKSERMFLLQEMSRCWKTTALALNKLYSFLKVAEKANWSFFTHIISFSCCTFLALQHSIVSRSRHLVHVWHQAVLNSSVMLDSSVMWSVTLTSRGCIYLSR